MSQDAATNDNDKAIESKEASGKAAAGETRKPYSPPVLVKYGKLPTVTTAGSSGTAELGSDSKNKRT